MIKAILFDFDGTLADTNPLIIRTFKETFAKMLKEKTLTEEEILACVGPTLEETGEKYFPENPQAFVDGYRTLNDKYHDDMINIYPGIIQMMEALVAKGLKLAIVSSKRRDFVIRGMKCVDLYDYFDYIVAADDVMRHKPDPEPLLKAMNHFGLKPHECLMVGDNGHDIHGAKNADILGIAVGWAFKGAEYLRALNPDYLVETPMDIVGIVDELRESL